MYGEGVREIKGRVRYDVPFKSLKSLGIRQTAVTLAPFLSIGSYNIYIYMDQFTLRFFLLLRDI
jgi:hypothetical protein